MIDLKDYSFTKLQKLCSEIRHSIDMEIVRDYYNIARRKFGNDNVDVNLISVQNVVNWMLDVNGMVNRSDEDIHNFIQNNLVDRKIESVSSFIKNHSLPVAIIIRFPELTVSNSKGYSTKMYDMFVKLSFNASGCLKNFEGLRTTYQQDHYTSGYSFSHLAGNAKRRGFTSFCTGEGPLSTLFHMMNITPDKNLYLVFLSNLSTYLSYESLDGGPYRLIRNITSNVELNNMFTEGFSIIAKAALNCLNSSDFIVDLNKKIKVTLRDSGVEKLKTLVEKQIFPPWILAMQAEDGRYYMAGASLAAKLEIDKKSKNPILTFKKEPIYLKIKDSEDVTEKQETTLNPELKRAIEKRCAVTIYESFVRSSQLTPSS